ncbi:MAG: PAS domain-containing sensor histidine kinase [Bacteroidaceae bacterium]|nr:PAS domain-containing sensor histidine kinase [Bacteroidaceae bacterium]
MKLKHLFLILVLGILAVSGIALYGTFHSHPWLFYITECFIFLLLAYLYYFYHKTLKPYDTLIGGMELVRDLDLTTRLALSGQYETDVIVRTFNDLLSRLRSEHLSLEEQYTFLSLLIEASPMGVVQCDLDGNITSLNPAAQRMMTPAVREALLAVPLGEERTLRLSGAPELYRLSHPSFPDRGYQHPFYLIESLTNEVRQAERAAYERVIRMIAHEVNNSVAGIVGALEEQGMTNDESGGMTNDESRFARNDESKLLSNPEGNSHSSFVTRHSSLKERSSFTSRLRSMSAFVTRFAEVVKIPAPQLQLCDLSEEVEACRVFLENLCLSSNVRLTLDLTDDAIPVRLDPVLFQQVLVNIVKNSVESIGGRKGGEVSITTSNQTLVVTDNGLGITDAVSQNLFTPFFSTKPGGQGLGLLLIRDILTAHGCSFSLQTDPADHLTRFSITFPASIR